MSWEKLDSGYVYEGQKVSLYELFKKLMIEARISRDSFLLKLFQVVIGEADNKVISREGKIEDARMLKIVESIISANAETFSKSGNVELQKENDYLQTFVPKLWNEEETQKFLENSHLEEIKSAASDGLAIKTIMGQIVNLPVDKSLVSKIIKKLRS